MQLNTQATLENELLPLRKEVETCKRDKDDGKLAQNQALLEHMHVSHTARREWLTCLCCVSSARAERARVETINAKLQVLARELQRDNRLVNERSQAAFAAEEQKRRDLQDSFQKTAGDISAR